MSRRLSFVLVLLACTGTAQAARDAVLKQVDLPHNYYWRELYIPQLTTGPDFASFMPSGDILVYSMGGSLWQQPIAGDTATELTHASHAYDNQPDVARDGRSVVFTRYDGRAIELWRLDLATGREQALTSAGAVNVEPRLSPDGRKLAWVSTQGSGHFNLFIADIDDKGLHHPRMLLGERTSKLDRYYYSTYDHAINPSWSPDGTTIYYVSNPEIAWGTGDLWSVPIADPSRRAKILSEETSWNARPEPHPDGKRLLYTSYHGRQWQQLWLTTSTGAAPLPLTFGEFDRRNARWSPDGKRIVYIDNQPGSSGAGNTSLRVLTLPGGATATVAPLHRNYKTPRARLVLDIVDELGARMPARVAVLGQDDRAYAPDDAWMQADDSFDRTAQSTETHYFHCTPPCALDVPVGPVKLWVQHGFAYVPWRTTVTITGDHEHPVRAKLTPRAVPSAFGHWISADLHIHMNYGGHYRNTPANLARQARAEDLDLAYDLVVNKEERIPDIAAFRTDADPASTSDTLVLHGQEFHTSFWGHLGLLHLTDHFLTPDFSSYRHTAMASPFPHNGVIADLAHAQGGLVGYVHPFDTLPDPAHDTVLSNALPADVINGKVDYIEVLGFSDHKATAQVWYRLLNLGFHLPTGAGTDAMANYASLRGPVGLNRVFLDTDGHRDEASALAALKAGHGFASNGPLLGLLLEKSRPGDTVTVGRHHYRVALRSPVAVEHLELVHNGTVIRSFALTGDHQVFDEEGDIDLDGGWLLLRAWNDGGDPQVLDIYPYATTNPIWLGEHVLAPSARDDATWFADWLSRTIEAASARDDYNTPEEKQSTLDYFIGAREQFKAMARSATPTPATQGKP